MRNLTIALALVVTGCSSIFSRDAQRNVLPPPSPVHAPEFDIVEACDALKRAGCPEAEPDASGDPCPTALAKIRAESTVIPTACVVLAHNATEIRMCGAPNTLRFTCTD